MAGGFGTSLGLLPPPEPLRAAVLAAVGCLAPVPTLDALGNPSGDFASPRDSTRPASRGGAADCPPFCEDWSSVAIGPNVGSTY